MLSTTAFLSLSYSMAPAAQAKPPLSSNVQISLFIILPMASFSFYNAISEYPYFAFDTGLLNDWNKGPHITGYVDFAQSIKDHHPQHNSSFPWASWSTCDSSTLSSCKTQLETCLESMAYKGIQLGTITSNQIFSTLNKWHRLDTALRRIIILNNSNSPSRSRNAISDKVSGSVLWERAVFTLSARSNAKEIDELLGLVDRGKSLSLEETSYFR